MNIIDEDFDEKIIRACKSTTGFHQTFSQLLAVPPTLHHSSQSTLSQITNNLFDNNHPLQNHTTNNSGNDINLEELLKDIDLIIDFLSNRIERSKSMFDYLKSVLKLYNQYQQTLKQQQIDKDSSEIDDSDSEDDESNRLKFSRADIIVRFLQTVIHVNSNQINEKDLMQCIDLILSECDSLEVKDLQDIINVIQSNIEINLKSSIYLILPKCMKLRGHLKSNEAQNSDEHSEYQSNTIQSIVRSKWPKITFIKILEALNDLPLSKKHLEDILSKVQEDLPSMNYSDIPSIVHQMVLISSQGIKGLILKAIVDFFNHEESKHTPNDDQYNQLMPIESTILLQTSFSIKQDMDIGKDYLKLKQSLSPFNFALLLTISKIPRFKTQVLNQLKSLIVHNYKDHNFIQEVLFSVVVSTSNICEIIVEPLVWFSISLMDANALVVNDQIRGIRKLGTEMLYRLFSDHENIRERIIDEIIGRIQMKSDNLQSWFSLLARISRGAPHSLMNSVPKLKESFEYIQYFSVNTVQQLLLAFEPILPLVPNFLDSIILILKKSMFKREIEARASAMGGFLQLLKNISNSNSFNELGVEILGIIKRGLTQQGSIRAQLYTGLKDLVLTRPHISEYICDILFLHFTNFFDATTKKDIPISLSECVEFSQGGSSTIIIEPIDKLVHCIQLCLRTVKKSQQQQQTQQQSQANSVQQVQLSEEGKQSFDRLLQVFNKFAITIVNTDIEIYRELSVSNESFKVHCQMYLGIIESLIEYCISRAGDKVNFILSLFEKHTQVSERLSNFSSNQKSGRGKKGGDKGGRKRKLDDEDLNGEDQDEEMHDVNGDGDDNISKSKKPAAKSKEEPLDVKLEKGTLSPEIIKDLFIFINELNGSNVKSDQKEQFKRFVYFSYQSCFDYLNKMFHDTKQFFESQIDNSVGNENVYRRNLSYCRAYLPLLLQGLETNGWSQPVKDSKVIPIQTLTLSCIALIIKYVKEFGNETNLVQCFVGGLPTNQEQAKEAIVKQAHSLEKICFDTAINGEFWTDADIIVSILSNLYKYIPFKSLNTHHKFIYSLYKVELPVSYANLASNVIRVLLETKTSNNNTISLEIISDIVNYMKEDEASSKSKKSKDDDDDDENSDIESRLLNKVTHIHMESEILKFINTQIDEAKERIVNLKRDWLTSPNERLNHEKNLIFDELKQENENLKQMSTLEYEHFSSATSDKYLKTIKKLFTIMTTLVSTLSTLTISPNDQLKQLISLSSELSSNVHNHLNSIDADKETDGLSRAQKLRVVREAKFIPLLKYTLEKYETTVIKYEKKLKINERLGKHFKNAIIRDFVIRTEVLQGKMDEEDQEEYERQNKKKQPPKKKQPAAKKKSPAAPKAKKQTTARKGRANGGGGGRKKKVVDEEDEYDNGSGEDENEHQDEYNYDDD